MQFKFDCKLLVKAISLHLIRRILHLKFSIVLVLDNMAYEEGTTKESPAAVCEGGKDEQRDREGEEEVDEGWSEGMSSEEDEFYGEDYDWEEETGGRTPLCYIYS